MVETKARRKLLKWMRGDAKVRTRSAIARSLRVSQPSVTEWVAGNARPKQHHREALEALSSGEVPATDWMLAEESAAASNVKPMTGTEG